MYEFHIFELRDLKTIAEKIITVVKYASYVAAKRKPEKIEAWRDSNPDLCDTGAALTL